MNANVRFWAMLGLLVAATVGLRFVSHGEAIPLEKPLATFPMTLGPWHGENLPLQARIVQAAGVDDYLNRAYTRASGPPLYLYIGYYKTQRDGRLIHSPKHCLPGGGWEPVTSKQIFLTFPGGYRAPVNLYVIQQGLDRQVVVYWYQSHGRIIASEYWAKFYMVEDALRLNRTDAALVRVSMPVAITENAAQAAVLHMAQALPAELQGILPQ